MPKLTKRLVYRIVGATIALLIVTELILRLAFGFGSPVLFQADSYTGYRFQPNQQRVRFGKRINYNQYSQRSETITPTKTPGVLRILMIGDSVLNGGSPIDQTQTITELLEAKIAAVGHSVEVLNASSGSWGIGNALGYLRQFGTFNSDGVILEIGTNDLTQPTSTRQRLDREPGYPSRAPLLAIEEVVSRYLWPQIAGRLGFSTATPGEIPTAVDPARQAALNRQDLTTTLKLIRDQGIPVFVVFVPALRNLIPVFNQPDYKAELLQLLQASQVVAIDTQAAWANLPSTTMSTYFRDDNHPTVVGNQAIVAELFQQLCTSGKFPPCQPKRG